MVNKDYKYLEIGTCDKTYKNLASDYPDELGISVEPIREYLQSLPTNNGRNIKVNAGISTKNGTQTINFAKNYKTKKKKTDASGWKGRSSFKSLQKLNIKEKNRFQKRKVKIMTLPTLFKKYNVRSIEIMRVDTEGYDGIIVNQLVNTKIRPKTLIYEHLHLDKKELQELRKRLRKDYRKKYTDKFDDKWILKKNTSQRKSIKRKSKKKSIKKKATADKNGKRAANASWTPMTGRLKQMKEAEFNDEPEEPLRDGVPRESDRANQRSGVPTNFSLDTGHDDTTGERERAEAEAARVAYGNQSVGNY